MIEMDHYAKMGSRSRCRWHEHISLCLVLMSSQSGVERAYGRRLLTMEGEPDLWEVISEKGD